MNSSEPIIRDVLDEKDDCTAEDILKTENYLKRKQQELGLSFQESRSRKDSLSPQQQDAFIAQYAVISGKNALAQGNDRQAFWHFITAFNHLFDSPCKSGEVKKELNFIIQAIEYIKAVDPLFEQAIQFFREGEKQKAVEQWQNAIDVYQKAIECLNPILPMHTSSVNVQKQQYLASFYSHIGYCSGRLMNKDQTLSAYQAALESYQKLSRAKYPEGLAQYLRNVAIVYYRFKEWQQFIDYFIKIMDDDYKKNHPEEYLNLIPHKARAHRKLKQWDEAIETWQSVLNFFNNKEYSKKRTFFERYVGQQEKKYKPSDETYYQQISKAYENIAGIYHKKKDWEKALEYYQKYHKAANKFCIIADTSVKALFRYNAWLSLCLEHNQLKKAFEINHYILDRLKNEGKNLLNQIFSYIEKEYLNAHTIFQEKIDRIQAYADHCVLQGRLYPRQYKLNEAIFYYREALRAYEGLRALARKIENTPLGATVFFNKNLNASRTCRMELQPIQNQVLSIKNKCRSLLAMSECQQWINIMQWNLIIATIAYQEENFKEALDYWEKAKESSKSIQTPEEYYDFFCILDRIEENLRYIYRHNEKRVGIIPNYMGKNPVSYSNVLLEDMTRQYYPCRYGNTLSFFALIERKPFSENNTGSYGLLK